LSSTYCPRIHHGLTLSAIRGQQVKYAVCCWAKDSSSTTGQIDWYHPTITKLRQQNEQGKLPLSYCSSCIDMENVGRQSMRQGYEIMHGEPTYDNSLKYLDINIDYTCNLACVTCGPDLSTAWRNELQIKDLSPRPHINEFLNKLNAIDFSHLKEIRLWGGEPLLTDTHRRILEYVGQRCDTSNVKLMYNTNGTQKINNYTRGLIEQYQFARISFSIDAVGPRFEYIRYPASWAKVHDNLLWWKENLPHNSMLSMTVTASMLNVLTLNEIYDWHQCHWQKSCYGDPIEIFVHNANGTLALENMPVAMADHLRSLENYCQPGIQKMGSLASNQLGPQVALHYLETLDRRRKLCFSDVLPELARWLHH